MSGRRKLELTALLGLAVQIVFLCTAFALYSASGSSAVVAEMWHLLPGVLVWFVVLLHGRQRRLAKEEREEMEKLREKRLSEELFEETELDKLKAKTGLRIFEKYVVPGFSILFSLVLFGLAYYVYSGIAPWGAEPEVQSPSTVGVGMVFISFLGFLTGKYAAGMARQRDYRLLRASAGYLLGNVVACLLVTVSMGALHFGLQWPHQVVTYLIPIGMALVGLEVIINLVLDIYRPRVPGQLPRPPYDSRTLGLFAEPGGVVQTISDTLDYQFGFKVSETWFYRFMERAIVPLLAVQIISLWLLTCITVVDQSEVAFIERLGQPVVNQRDAQKGLKATVYEPGYYLKAPWPFDITRHVSAYNVHRFRLGRVFYDEQRPTQDPERAVQRMTHPQVLLWTDPHIHQSMGYQPNLLVPSSRKNKQEKGPGINLARVRAFVHYRIKQQDDGDLAPGAVYRYYYGHQDTSDYVQDLAYAVLARIAASQDFQSWLSTDRLGRNREFVSRLQKAVDRRKLGVNIISAGVPVVHPPAEVAQAMQGVLNASQQKQSIVSVGQAEALSTKSEGKVKSIELTQEAKGESYSISTLARADAKRFTEQLKAYRKAPEVYRNRRYFTALESVLSDHRLFVLPDTKREVQVLDLKEEIRPELLDFSTEEVTQ